MKREAQWPNGQCTRSRSERTGFESCCVLGLLGQDTQLSQCLSPPKTLNELAPDYLQCLFTQRHVNNYNLRNLEGKLSLPKPNTNYLKRSFCYSGACLWNNLLQDLKSVASVGQFKRGIKKVSEISDSHTAIM